MTRRGDGPGGPAPVEAVGPGEGLPDRVDVVVIGGGIAGASALWHLARLGVDAALLERGQVGGGATGAAVGVLSPPLRQPYHETAHDRGADAARRVWDFAARSVRGLGEALSRLDCSAEAEVDLSGGWMLAESHTAHEVEDAYLALERAGFDVSWHAAAELEEALGGRGFTGGFRMSPGGALRPGAAARCLATGAREAGARMVEGVEVEDVVRREDGSFCCYCADGEVRSEMVVYATHVDSGRFSGLLAEEIVPIRGQGLTLELARPFPAGGSFSTHWKLNVWRRSTRDERTIHLGGWRHDAWDRAYSKTRPEIDRHLQADLLAWFEQAFPRLGKPRVTERWSGVFGWTADYLPMVGPLPGSPGELVIGGFSGGGLPFAFESGRVVAHIVAGHDPVPGAELLAPRRFR
ncbi:MAG: FAD-binding oxidoreductase [Gemmatimonadota bacterium]